MERREALKAVAVVAGSGVLLASASPAVLDTSVEHVRACLRWLEPVRARVNGPLATHVYGAYLSVEVQYVGGAGPTREEYAASIVEEGGIPPFAGLSEMDVKRLSLEQSMSACLAADSRPGQLLASRNAAGQRVWRDVVWMRLRKPGDV